MLLSKILSNLKIEFQREEEMLSDLGDTSKSEEFSCQKHVFV